MTDLVTCCICQRTWDEIPGTVYCASQHGVCGLCGLPRAECKCLSAYLMKIGPARKVCELIHHIDLEVLECGHLLLQMGEEERRHVGKIRACGQCRADELHQLDLLKADSA